MLHGSFSTTDLFKETTIVTDNEKQRLETLQLYRILDSISENAFDDLAELAGVICDAPISLVSFIDEKRQWFKSRIGISLSETPRDQAFCAHAIEQNQVMVVDDAAADDRFADNPLVTGEPGIRFYAGAPLVVADGQRLGTLCVIDRTARTLTPAQLRSLAVVRDAVVTQLELRKAAQDLEAMESLVPMCSWCKQVRMEGTDGEQWIPIHRYLQQMDGVTHGICPSCKVSIA